MKKKAFTLVELLVVIAILAIIATVSIVGYTSFINKAKQSNDESLASQYNLTLKAMSVDDDLTLNDVVYCVALNGTGSLETQLDDHKFVWDKSTGEIVLVESDETNENYFDIEYEIVDVNETAVDYLSVFQHPQDQ